MLSLPDIDWRVASIVVMLFVGIFNVVSRKFFDAGGDWRIFIPVVALAALILTAYFAVSYRDVKVTTQGITLACIMVVMVATTVVLTALVYANKNAPLSIAIPIMGMSIVITSMIAIGLLGESLTLTKGAGIVLGVASIALLAWQ